MAQSPGNPPSSPAPAGAPRRAPLTMRRATMKDLHPIVKIWMNGVQMAQGLTPPPLDEVVNLFASRIESQSPVYGIWVAEVDGAVAGWQGLQACRPNPIMRWAESSTYISMQH